MEALDLMVFKMLVSGLDRWKEWSWVCRGRGVHVCILLRRSLLLHFTLWFHSKSLDGQPPYSLQTAKNGNPIDLDKHLERHCSKIRMP